jgi:hypothetical protein
MSPFLGPKMLGESGSDALIDVKEEPSGNEARKSWGIVKLDAFGVWMIQGHRRRVYNLQVNVIY